MAHAITTRNSINTIPSEAYNLTGSSPISRFLAWCEAQEKDRFLWLGLTFFGLIGLAVPCVLFAILQFAGNNFNLWILTCLINTPVLAITLAAQPTKITLPALFAAWTADFLIIAGTFAYFLAS